MQRDNVTVTLAVGAAPWQKTLPASLLKAGMLRRVLTSNPYLEIQDPNGNGSLHEIKRFPLNRIVNGVLWGAWRRLPKDWRPRSAVMVTVLMRDQLWIPPCSVFHGWMRQSLVSLPAAKRQGARTLVENAGRHPGHFHKAPWEECQRFKIKPSQHSPLLPTELIRRMEREYEICDRIVVPSNLARSSFAEFGLADKTSVVFPGVDEQFFFPAAAAGGTATAEELVPRLFCCSPRSVQGGRLSAASVEKARLGQCRTAAGGEVRPEMKELLETHAGSGVRAAGFLTIEKLVELYRESDLFVFPSVNEGLAQVLLEAMAAGSPVVSTELSGARDCVTEGKEGFIVPARDVDRTAQAIQWCCDHRDETRAMGRAARARIEKQFTLDHYNQPMIALYRGLAGTAD